ncbi:MAG: amino acid racemase [Bacillota bacterium]|nr:amino acid racemase [Bacillota bacterium]
MLGIIGGMGPMASSLFYNMLIEKTPADRDQDHLDLVMLSHASMPDRTAAILSGDEAQINHVKELLRSDMNKLLSAGCSRIVITCNTAHFFVDMLEDEEKRHVIHMIRETAAAAKARPAHSKAAVLSTDGTAQTGIYQNALEAEGIDVFTLSDCNQQKIMTMIYDYIKRGLPVPEAMWNEVQSEIVAAGCDLAVLGCTELSTAARQLGLDISDKGFYLDPMDVLASKCISIFGKA